jgi:hypothetical protein
MRGRNERLSGTKTTPCPKEADTRGMNAVFVEHTGCAADIGVVDGRKDVEGACLAVSCARARRGGLASSQGSGWG